MTNVKELYKKYMDNMPVDIKTKKKINAYSNKFWKEQENSIRIQKMLLKYPGIIQKDWWADAKADTRAMAKAIAQAKADVKTESKADYKVDVKAEAKRPLSGYQLFLKEWQPKMKEAHPELSNTERFAKIAEEWQKQNEFVKAKAAKAKMDAIELVEMRLKWEAIFREHEERKAAVRAKPMVSVMMEIMEDSSMKSSYSAGSSAGKVKRNLHGYNLFYREQYYSVKELKPELKNSEIMVEIARLWHLKKKLAINLVQPRMCGNNVSNATSGYTSVSNSVSRTPVGADDYGGPSWWWQHKGCVV
jgi:hypothetical protein